MVSMTELTEWTRWFQKRSGNPILIIRFILSKNLPAFAALPDFRRVVRPPFVFDPFQPLNLARSPINPVAVDNRTRFWISATFGVVIFPENELKVRARRLFGDVRDTIQ